MRVERDNSEKIIEDIYRTNRNILSESKGNSNSITRDGEKGKDTDMREINKRDIFRYKRDRVIGDRENKGLKSISADNYRSNKITSAISTCSGYAKGISCFLIKG